MRRLWLGLAAMFIAATFCAGNAAWGAETRFTGQDLILRGLNASYRLRFSEAREIFSRLASEYPSSPAGVFYTAAIDSGMAESDMRWRMVARLYADTEPPRRTVRKADEIAKNLNGTIARCRAMLQRNPNDFEALFYMAGSYAFLARVEMHGYNLFSAMSYGKKSAGYFDKLLERYPDNGDAMIGPGIYKYYVGKLPKPMQWLVWMLGLSGTKEEGMRLVVRAHETAALSKIEAADFIARSYYLHDKDYPKALQWADTLEREAPDAPLADFTRLFAYHNTKSLDNEEATLIKLMEKLQTIDPETRRDWEPLMLFALGTVSYKKLKIGDARSYFTNALAVAKIDPWLAGEVSNHLKRADYAARQMKPAVKK